MAVAEEVVSRFVLSGNLDSRSANRALLELPVVLHGDLGFRHDLTLRLVKQEIINAWDWSVWTSDATIPLPNPIAFGVLLFDQDGRPILLPDFVPGLNVLFGNGAPPFMAERAVPVMLDRVTGHPGNTTLRVLPRAIPREPTRTPTRTPLASVTATPVSGSSISGC
ncbi:MAG: hypothetical protein FJ033_05495 [Chloroflexi bacterium]|nr:hypothetical protein [Chloroflexota bacterium]